MEYAFWVFLFVMMLLIPAVMLFYGWIFLKMPPENINSSYGYRSPRSMKNRETWQFAHAYCGKLWFRMSWGVLAVSIVWMTITLSKDVDAVGRSACILMGVQMVPFLASITLTERALKREFDESGRKRP